MLVFCLVGLPEVKTSTLLVPKSKKKNYNKGGSRGGDRGSGRPPGILAKKWLSDS